MSFTTLSLICPIPSQKSFDFYASLDSSSRTKLPPKQAEWKLEPPKPLSDQSSHSKASHGKSISVPTALLMHRRFPQPRTTKRSGSTSQIVCRIPTRLMMHTGGSAIVLIELSGGSRQN